MEVDLTARISRVGLSSLVTLIIVSTAIFGVLRILPGDVALQIVGEGTASKQDLAALRHRLGTDRPLVQQYGDWVGKLLRADPGNSLIDRKPIIDEFKQRFPLTLELAVVSTALAALIALPAGIIGSVQRSRPLGYLVRVLGIAGTAMPVFWTGTLVLLLLLSLFNWTPPVGYRSLFAAPATHLQQVIFPVLALALAAAALLSRLVAGSMDDVLRHDFVRTATAKGLGPRTVLLRHALRNALLPVITVFGYQFAFLLGGTVVTEQLFGLPGLGTWFVQAITQRDYPVVQFLVMFYVLAAIGINLLVDISYTVIDPRTR